MKKDNKPSRIPKKNTGTRGKSLIDTKSKGKPVRPSKPTKHEDKPSAKDGSARPAGRKTYAEKFPSRESTSRSYDDKNPRRDNDSGSFGKDKYDSRKPSKDNDAWPKSKDSDRKYSSDKGSRSVGKDKYDNRKPSRDNDERPERKERDDRRPARDNEARSFGKDKYDNRKPSRDTDTRPERKERDDRRPAGNGARSSSKDKYDNRRPSRDTDARPERKERDDRRPARGDSRSYGKEKREDERPSRDSDSKPFNRRSVDDKKPYQRKGEEDKKRGKDSESFRPSSRKRYDDKRPGGTEDASDRKNKGYSNKKVLAHKKKQEGDGLIRLNKFIANSGICSRREADVMIETGVVTVNGKIVTELGYKVAPEDQIKYNGQSLKREKSVYVLLNKPKDFITTLDDPQGRKTVMSLIANAGKERIFPVGRLDRNTTGLLLFTNDGDLTKKLTHPKHGIKKIYHVQTDETVKKSDLDKIKEGIELEDGFIKADDVSYVGEAGNKKEVGIEIHQGKNRIVRRIFEHLGYKVLKLDRVYIAGLTKKALPRGHWRFLTDKEIAMLKMIS